MASLEEFFGFTTATTTSSESKDKNKDEFINFSDLFEKPRDRRMSAPEVETPVSRRRMKKKSEADAMADESVADILMSPRSKKFPVELKKSAARKISTDDIFQLNAPAKTRSRKEDKDMKRSASSRPTSRSSSTDKKKLGPLNLGDDMVDDEMFTKVQKPRKKSGIAREEVDDEEVNAYDTYGSVFPVRRGNSVSGGSSPRNEPSTPRTQKVVATPVSAAIINEDDFDDDDVTEDIEDEYKPYVGLAARDEVEQRFERKLDEEAVAHYERTKTSHESESSRSRRRSSVPTPNTMRRASINEIVKDYNEVETVIDSIEAVHDQHKTLPENIRRLIVEANMGWPESQFTLGYCFDQGTGGVSVDTSKAMQWYQEAANQGHVTAMNNLGVLLATGHRHRVKPNLAEAFYWYKKAADKKHPNAEFHVGLSYLKGDGLDAKDEKEAFKWFERAAKRGHVLAMTNIGAMYMSGQGVKQDFKKAKKWSQRAADSGSAIAHHNIAVIYDQGYGVSIDKVKSNHHLKAATTGINFGIISKELSEDTLKAGNTLMNI